MFNSANDSPFGVNKQEPIRISWNGNEDCFVKNRVHLLNALGNGILSWQRENKPSFPLNLRFSLTTEHYNDAKSIYSNSRVGDNNDAEVAFVHIYFINAANFDEYRLSVRPEISEWFASLNESDWSHWIIFYDSSRVKDKKSKTSVIDKLRSDFARFQNRLFESSDLSGEKTSAAFSALLQTTLFSSFDTYTSRIGANLQKLKESINENTFTPHALVNEQFRLCKFFWNLGLFDSSLAELDALTSFLSDSIRALAKTERTDFFPQWLKQLRLLPLDRRCNLIGAQMQNSIAAEDWPLVKLHSHILSHQILLCAHSLQHRLNLASAAAPAIEREVNMADEQVPKTSSEEQRLNTLQLRHNSIAAILRYTQEAIQRLEEDMLALGANYNSVLLDCLVLVWQAECFMFCGYLLSDGKKLKAHGEEMNILMEVSTASSHINFLVHKKCEAILHLQSTLLSAPQHNQQGTVTRRWLEQTPLEENSKFSDSLTLFRSLSEMICSATANADRSGVFIEFARNSLLNAIESFSRFGWSRHAHNIQHRLAELLEKSAPSESYKFAICNLHSLLANGSLLIGCREKDALPYLDGMLQKLKTQMSERGQEKLLIDGCLTMLSLLSKSPRAEAQDEELVHRWRVELIRATNRMERGHRISNLNWPSHVDDGSGLARPRRPSPLVAFPFSLERMACNQQTLLSCSLHSPLSLQLQLTNRLAISLQNCTLKARFQCLSGPSSLCSSRTVVFRTASEKNEIHSLECLSNDSQTASNSTAETSSRFFELTQCTHLFPGTNKCALTLQKVEEIGCFRLISLFVRCTEIGIEFALDYLEEMAQNQKLEHVLCSVEVKKPNIVFLDGGNCEEGEVLRFLAGIEQQFWMELCPGTLALEHSSSLTVSFVGIPPERIQFSGKYVAEAEFAIPPLKSDKTHRLNVHMCLNLERIRSIGTEVEKREHPGNYEMKVEWRNSNGDSVSQMILSRFVAVQFRPVMVLQCSTSLLAGHISFILDVQRGTESRQIIEPREVTLHQEHNIALEPVQADLLNPRPFKPIVPDSTYRFIWRLPESVAGKSVPIPHFLELKYRLLEEQDGNEYQFKQRLDFPVGRVEYELCARFFSEQSQSVLCRIDQPCDLVVSIRSLAKLMSEAETLIVSIDHDPSGHWHCHERHKLARVKDSGVGQALFTVVPKRLGFLPYPALSIHTFNHSDHSPSRQQSINEKRFGERLMAFYRNRGSQIHILGPLHGSDAGESASLNSGNTAESSESKKKSLKSQAKDRLQKLFE